MNTTLMNFNVPTQVKNDFQTVCRLNCTSMTSELVRFINTFVLDESKRMKSYKIESKEINKLKRNKLDRPTRHKNWEDSYQ